MIKLNKLQIKNFLSYKEATIDLSDAGLVLIEGINRANQAYQSNSSGKSNLLAGITYALYGKTVTNVSADGVVNKEVGKDSEVILWLTKGDTKYRIERYRKDKENKNKVKLFSNDKEITGARISDTNSMIDDIIGIDFSAYVNTICYGQGDAPIFSQATDKEKKEILEDLANISIYAKAQKVAGDKQKELQNSLTIDKQKEVSMKQKRDLYHSQAASNEQSYLSQLERKKKAEAEYNNKKKEYIDLRNKSKNDYVILSNKKEVLKKELAAISLPKMNSGQYTQVSQEYSNKKGRLEVVGSQLKEQVEQYRKIQSQTHCPVCGQVLDQAHRNLETKNVATKIKELTADYNQIKQDIPSIKDQLDKLENENEHYQEEMSSKYSLREQKNNSINEIDSKLRDITQKVNSKKSEVDSIKSLVDYEIDEPNLYKKELDEVDKSLTKLHNRIMEENKEEQKYGILSSKVFSRKGIPSMIMDLVTPFLNEHANYYLNTLSGSELSINITPQSVNADNSLADKFDIQVENNSGANSYQNCSAGERKRIDIAISFAIQDLQQSHSNIETNFAIYDECFDGLDEIGCESVVNILKEKNKTISSIFVITHNQALKPLFDNYILVEKGNDGISHVVKK